ncbi:E3 ubiquitin-protein ligase bre1 [Coccidioides immitis RS]|uniref:E3 ubiquitin protein ligase n=3 Tax=Coccidioides immitis TaxID=5501 RepID=A0A0E1RZA6_COCIM|nr:E3 ubiquitin-protein ligase bre1 [Coccidioides immitis RS]EAS37331.1 E3 ubiquitin-protein ligase bre1 [Coccidioides immitis RS]KMP02216.1 E3 ubiquitin-protein ligase bre1 [Coccidioides immitis RMSCC 2394]KMU89322.1 E3 ubiquitin-protein ligase bre1 [Coccidioides immitis H538.4]TPX24708.1 E3 ubiquitin-protein ligase bre1 [Coccidioides immitis]
MTVIEASTVPLTKPGLVGKMEDRKRPASHDPSDSTPPSKRQATSVNGGAKIHPDADMPWKDDLERFQKDAILRQMQEYKREKTTLEARIKELTKSAAYHDEHIRVIDAWLQQLLDEVKVLLGPLGEASEDSSPPQSALLFTGNENFQKHLKDRADLIKSTMLLLSARAPKASRDVAELQSQLNKKLAEEKATIAELDQALADKQQLEERLEAASLRYMVAEKRIDRAKSLTVARLEKQYILGAQKSSGENMSARREESSGPNGPSDSTEKLSELEMSYNKTIAISEIQKEQIEKLEAENSKLSTQLTDLHVKLSKLSDEDYSQTDLFKQLKSQHEDVIKRVNHLEATNVQLREEAKKLQTERTAYQVQIENEVQASLGEKEAYLSKVESDLARIRNARDELLADQQMRKAAQEQEKFSLIQMKELLEAREARITSLESEVERLHLQIDGVKDVRSATTELSMDELRAKYETLDKQYELLNTELSSMQAAFKRTSKLASQKITEFANLEDKIQRLIAEKSKADQKYFAAMKSKEARDLELRTLRVQNMKSSDIISQLKESESMTRNLVSNVEKQLSETKEALNSALAQHRASQQQVTEANLAIQGLRLQVAELKALLANRDASLASANSTCRKAENTVEGLKSILADTKKSLESWKAKGLGNSSSEYEMLRTLALCTVCRRTWKNTAIKTCGHVFCKECVEERLTSRSRKCPNCNKSFGNNDYMHITL